MGDDPLLGRMIGGKFRVERALGAGAMGRVYLAEQTNLGKKVAIKVLQANLAGDPSLEKRFVREARSASVLSHPNIVQTIDFGQEDGLLYIAMELLAGRDLGKAIKHEFPFAPERIGHIVGQVLSALEEAHEKGIVHRDLKPENIMLLDVRGEDFVKVCDFGIAKATSEREAEGSALTSAGMVCGTPEYMSPEQARGDALDGRSDLYAAACILYLMACGELPFRAETTLGVVTRLLNDAPVPPSKRRPDGNVPPALEAMILRGLEKDRDQRFPDAHAMREALFEAVGIKRPSSSSQPRARPAGASDPEIALADTGVATPASQPALPPGGSVHGEMEAANAPSKRSWAVLAAAGTLAVAAAVVGGRAFLTKPAPIAPPVVQPATAAPVVPPPPTAVVTPTHDVEPPHGDEPAPPPAVLVKKEHHHHKLAAQPAAKPIEKPAPPPEDGFQLLRAEALRLFNGGDVPGALAKYLEAARLRPNAAGVQRQIGKCYNRLGQRERAQPYLKRYLELEPNAPDAAFIRAMIQ